MIWQSEAILYGLMIGNGLLVLAALAYAWRRGHLDDLEGAAGVLFENTGGDGQSPSTGSEGDPS